MPPLRLAACLLNIAEARRTDVVERIVAETAGVVEATRVVSNGVKCEATIVNVFADHIYNRTVITLAGSCRMRQFWASERIG